MQKSFAAALALAMLVGCGKKDGQQSASADSLSRDLQLAPAESTTAINDRPSETPPAATPSTSEPAPSTAKPAAPKPKPTTPAPTPSKPAPPAPKAVSLDSGVVVTASAVDSLHSRHNKAGETFTATVSEDVKDASGHVAIPAGSVITFKVIALEPAKNKSAADGKVRISAQEVVIGGQSYPISGEAGAKDIEHDLVGQGVTAGAAVRVGAGAAGGAVAGKVVGGKTGAIVGGIAGAVGGAVLADKTADRDVVVAPGFKVIVTLGANFNITR